MELVYKVKNSVSKFSALTMLPHSLFSLPYGIVAVLLTKSDDYLKITAVVLALLSARSAANAFNRIADNRFDKLNPRTRNRPLATGVVNDRFAVCSVVICLAVFFTSVLFLEPVCILLLPFAVIFCLAYSFAKRFTFLCHYHLGLACGLSVLGAYLCLAGTLDAKAISLYFAAALQVAGFDILYALDDINFDRKYGLFSVPARFGFKRSLTIAKITFFVSTVFFALFICLSQGGPFLAVAVTVVAVTMQYALLKATAHKSVLHFGGKCSVLFLMLYCIDLLNIKI